MFEGISKYPLSEITLLKQYFVVKQRFLLDPSLLELWYITRVILFSLLYLWFFAQSICSNNF